MTLLGWVARISHSKWPEGTVLNVAIPDLGSVPTTTVETFKADRATCGQPGGLLPILVNKSVFMSHNLSPLKT